MPKVRKRSKLLGTQSQLTLVIEITLPWSLARAVPGDDALHTFQTYCRFCNLRAQYKSPLEVSLCDSVCELSSASAICMHGV